MPRGLFCMIMTHNPGPQSKHDGSVESAPINHGIANTCNQRDSFGRGHQNRGQLPARIASLSYPYETRPAADDVSQDSGGGMKNTFTRVNAYLDRRAVTQYVSVHKMFNHESRKLIAYFEYSRLGIVMMYSSPVTLLRRIRTPIAISIRTIPPSKMGSKVYCQVARSLATMKQDKRKAGRRCIKRKQKLVQSTNTRCSLSMKKAHLENAHRKRP